MREGFGAFILSNGRPREAETTINTLARCGYTGPWWLVLDDEDPTHGKYVRRWGAERLLTFHKDDAAQDMGDNGGVRGVIVYARNAVDGLARELGLTHYIVLDDDYSDVQYRWPEPRGKVLRTTSLRNLDAALEAMCDFLETTGALAVAMGQGGDFFGGPFGKFYRVGLSRKAMNSFVIRTGSPLRFVGRTNEDVNAYVTLGNRGHLLFTVTRLCIVQKRTQKQSGGMTETYTRIGTYRKSFYSVMMAPSCVRIMVMGSSNYRIHHRVTWNRAVPKILSGKWQKPQT